jgi:hypothetical protein
MVPFREQPARHLFTHPLLVIVTRIHPPMLFSQLDLDIRPGYGLGIFKLGQCRHPPCLPKCSTSYHSRRLSMDRSRSPADP